MTKATVFYDLDIFTTLDLRPEGAGVTPTTGPIIAVLARALPEGAHQKEARWSISFIGTLQEFQQSYADRMARLFGRGEARLPIGRLSEGDFLRHLNRQIDRAQSLSAQSLNRRGIRAVSWSEDDADTLNLTGQLTAQDDSGQLRYYQPLSTSEDVYTLIAQALTLKDQARQSGTRNTVWIGRPSPEARAPLPRQVA